jgi:radical SAM family uncharacterized protein/radical SAM-linked protein
MLDEILPLVKKPIRYTGGEYNITIKTEAVVWVGIVFPEVYEIGMSNLGIKIIYHLFNHIDGIQCERIFAPWPDFGDTLKNTKTALYGLETRRPVGDFDLVGFSLQSELCYTTVLYILELAHIPLQSTSRDKSHPILLAGGPATLNPTPLSSVFDGFVIGDGEDVVPRIAEILKTFPKEKKDERLQKIAELQGVWVPNIHGRDTVIKKYVVPQLTEDTIPSPAILPICDITHDRLAIEVMRGCGWGCRFCQAGYTNRPLRIRSHTEIVKAVERGVRQTGWEEISLLSFSILDYPDILNLIRKLNEILRKKMISISLPAMRGELFSENLAVLLREIKKTGLTFAPEAGSEQLRCRLNKSFSNDTLINSINTAYRLGWKQVKLYFMIGLPFEKDNDIDEINVLIENILQAYPKGSIKLSVNPFIPKPHTPFESTEFAPIDELYDKIEKIKREKKRRTEVKYQTPEVAFIEAFLSKGDEKVFPVIESVYKQGGRFEEWREGFDFSHWRAAFDRTGIDPHYYLNSKDNYPWDFIDIGVKKDFLREEYNRAQKQLTTKNCYYTDCTNCGACDGAALKHYADIESYISYDIHPKKKSQPRLYRAKYTITEAFRYASHLDITRTIYRTLRRSDLPIQFTEGFSPIPKVSFCPPKSVGQIAKGEFFDFYLIAEYFGNISQELNARFPSGIRILEVRSLPIGVPSLTSSINLVCYEVTIPADHIKKSLALSTHTSAYVRTKSGVKNVAESVESISMNGNVLHCGLHFGQGTINIYSFVSYLTDLPVESTKKYKITRTALFIKNKGIVYSPMEVM